MMESNEAFGVVTGDLCLFCGEPEQVEPAEIWTDGTFTLQCCCEDLHEAVAREMADDPA